MSEESKMLTSFKTRRGLFLWNVMHHGYKTFQVLMNKVLWGAGAYANTHQDDIIVISDSWDEHLNHIRDVLERLRSANLTARESKIQFARDETTCLGFVMGKGTICSSP